MDRLLTINDRDFIAVRGQETVYGTIQINKHDCDEIYKCTHSPYSQMPRKDIGKIPRRAPFFGIKLDGFLKCSSFQSVFQDGKTMTIYTNIQIFLLEECRKISNKGSTHTA